MMKEDHQQGHINTGSAYIKIIKLGSFYCFFMFKNITQYMIMNEIIIITENFL